MITDSNDILDHLKAAVVVLDQELSVLYLNQTAQSLCGQSLSRSLGTPFHDLFKDPHLEPKALRTNLASDQPFTKRETSLRIVSNGERITANYSISPLQDGRVLIEIEPLDRFKQINREDQNRTTQRATRELVRDLAHEVKIPSEVSVERLNCYKQNLPVNNTNTPRSSWARLTVCEIWWIGCWARTGHQRSPRSISTRFWNA